MLYEVITASEAVREVRGEPAGEKPWITQCLEGTQGPVIAASDYVSALADLVRPYVPAGRPYIALGTDGYGRSDTRAALRSFFAVDIRAIVRAVLAARG